MKHWRYLKYIVRHRWFVLVECARRGILWRGIVHDLSKLRPDEWGPYAENFYGTKKRGEYFDLCALYGCPELAPWGTTVGDLFNLAWLKHQHRNPHHWQYWILREDDGGTFPLPMPTPYRLEMLCDWIGAGRACGFVSPPEDPTRATRRWYAKNRHRISLHRDTREWIEAQLAPPAGEKEEK